MNSKPSVNSTGGTMPKTAMVLAAGIGRRMRPLTDDRPKPLVEVLGKPLIDYNLDRLAAAGVERAVVNLHHFADRLEAHLRARSRPAIVLSNERDQLLDTGGGIVRALPLLGAAPFFLVNSDSLWLEHDAGNLARLARGFDHGKMDALLLLASSSSTVGYDGHGDYTITKDGLLHRRDAGATAAFVYAGGALIAPSLFRDAPGGAFSLLRLFDRAERERRLYGIALEGLFLHVGTPAAIQSAEQAIRRACG